MMLRWTGRTAVLAAVMLTTMIYAVPCQSQSYAAATQNKSTQGLWVVNFNFFDEFQGEALKKSGSPKPTFGLTFSGLLSELSRSDIRQVR
jgi:hypothetical protein